MNARAPANTTDHEYIVVGSGAGGGPLAARLALAGHSVLLIEAGDDQGANVNYTVPSFNAKVTEDPAMAWDFYVRHYADDERQRLDYKTVYDTPEGTQYIGLDPPAGSTMKGTLYPRAATIGGCTAHNALVTIYPHRSDFEYIQTLTGDDSWDPDNMRKYFVALENNHYYPGANITGHGYGGWLGTDTAPATLAAADSQLLSMLLGGIAALNGIAGTILDLASFLAGDANSALPGRDSTQAFYQIPLSASNGARSTVRDFLLDVANAVNADGSKKYPLDIKTDTYVTKVDFDTTGETPVATGVSYLEGKSLYRADPRSGKAAPGVPGTAKATREVIVAGGTYNSPQILKLSGVGPADELKSFGIPVVKDLPGVGTNLQDHYEVTVQGTTANNFTILDGCTWSFDDGPDPCLEKWETGTTNQDRGTYVSNGLVATMFYKSSTSPDGGYDEFLFGGPVNFRGYFPGYSVNATINHNWWSWALLKAHPRNNAGNVLLRSADPLDMPKITFNYFDTGVGDYQADLQTIVESIDLARYAFGNQTVKFEEQLPGANVQTRQEKEDYIKNTAWGHHASSSVPIGADDDPLAVLDSSFRVRGVQGLRVVDASVYPRIPGTFTLVSTYLVSEKAADVILSGLSSNASSKH